MKNLNLDAGKSVLLKSRGVILVCLVSLISIYITLGKYGIRDQKDTIRYITSGLSLLEEGKEGPCGISYRDFNNEIIPGNSTYIYPGMAFQLIGAAFCKAFFNSAQPSMIAMLSFFTLVGTNIVLYLICRLRLEQSGSILIISCLNVISLLRLYPSNMIRPLSDTWMMVFVAVAALAMINGKSIVSGAVLGLGYFFRSQIIPLSPLVLIFSPQKRLCKMGVLFATFVFVIISITKLFSYIFILDEGGSGGLFFYKKAFLDNADFGNFFAAIPETWSIFRRFSDLKIFLYLLPMICLAIFVKFTTSLTRRVCWFALASFVVTFLGWVIMTISVKTGHAPRYFLYSLPFHLIGVAFFTKDVELQYGPWFSQIASKARLILWFVVVITATSTLVSLSPNQVYNKFRQVDFDPCFFKHKVPRDAVIAVSGRSLELRLYTLFRTRKIVKLPNAFEEFFSGKKNSQIDYLVIGRGRNNNLWVRLATQEQIKDRQGITFERVFTWRGGALNYAFYKRIKELSFVHQHGH